VQVIPVKEYRSGMNNNAVAILLFVVFGAAMYGLGRAHRPRTPWQDGYQQGVADTTKSMFKNAVRAAASNSGNAANSAPGRFRPRFPFVKNRGRAPVRDIVALKDEATEVINNPLSKHASGLDEDTTVRLLRRQPDREAAA
jgi:hypothetical protein